MGKLPESAMPVTLSRYLMWRIVAVSVVILALALLLALGQAQSNIAHEERGAAQVARLLDHLGGLESGAATAIDAHLAALQETNRSGQLRHLQLKIEDGQGRVRVQPVDDRPATPLESIYVRLLAWLHPLPPVAPTEWQLQRDDGRRFRATLLIDPAGEQRESLAGVLGLLVILFGFAVVMVLATYLTVRRALRPMRALLAAIRAYEADDYAVRLPPQPLHELDAVGSALNRMADAIQRGQTLRRQLSAKMLTLQEDERERIARELHDELGQRLTAMRADAAWLLRHDEDDAELHAVARDLAGNCAQVQHDVRDLLQRLRPVPHTGAGQPVPLNAMLDSLVQSWRGRPDHGIALTLETAFDDAMLPPVLAVTLYRLSQEALTNAMRHAHATRVALRVTTDSGVVCWEAVDDGAGIASPDRALHQGNGLAGMCERVWSLHGEIEIEGHGGLDGGTSVRARLPLATPAAPMAPMPG